MRKSRKEIQGCSTSNLVLDVELAKKFNDLAIVYARSLANKYYSVGKIYDPEDIVQETWSKIIRQDIGFDENSKKSFAGFVYMMINNRYIDFGRKIKKEANDLSTDDIVGEDEGGKSRMIDFIAAGDEYSENSIINEIYIRQFIDKIPEIRVKVKRAEKGSEIIEVCLKEIFKLFVIENMTFKEIAGMLGVTTSSVSKAFNDNKVRLGTLFMSFSEDTYGEATPSFV